MLLRMTSRKKLTTYIFVGTATDHNVPFANASVLVRLMSDDQTVTKGASTGADGSYSIEVSIEASDNSPIDWTMEAYTPDFKKVELSGRKIVQRIAESENKPIVVNTPVEFVLSSAK